MAMSSDLEISQVNLLSTDAPAASESEHEASPVLVGWLKETNGVSLPSAVGGGKFRRIHMAGVASLLLLAASAAAFLKLGGSTNNLLVQKPEPITIPPVENHQNLPEIEQLFSLAQTVHPDLDQRVQALIAEHHIPDLLHNGSATMTDPEETLRKMQKDLEPKISTMRSLQIAACFADTWQLVLQIGSIVVNIRASQQACADPYPETESKRNLCASMVTLNLALWMYAGTHICNMWSSCPGVFSKNATCALGPVGILSSSFTLANAGATMTSNCKQGLTTPAPPMDPKDRKAFDRARAARERLKAITAFGRGDGRRLGGKAGAGHAGDVVGEFLKKASDKAAERKSMELQRTRAGHQDNQTREAEGAEGEEAEGAEGEEDKTVVDHMVEARAAIKEKHDREVDEKWAIAACVFDTQKVAARLIQAVTFLGFAALDCREEVFQKQGHQAKDKCVIDIGIMVASLAIAANMISISMINCPHTLEYMPDNLCAAGILNVISSAGYVAVAFAGIHDACVKIDPDGI